MMNHDEMNDGKKQDEVAVPRPAYISDERSAALCDFLAELSMAADIHYLCQIRRYREKNRPPVAPEKPWMNVPRD